MSLFAICGVGVIAAVAALILREWKSGAAAAAVAISAVCIIGTVALLRYSDAVVAIAELAEGNEAASSAASLALRALGVGFVAQIGGDICRDLGESSVASCVEAVGRAEMLLLCLPEFVSFVSRAIEMIG